MSTISNITSEINLTTIANTTTAAIYKTATAVFFYHLLLSPAVFLHMMACDGVDYKVGKEDWILVAG